MPSKKFSETEAVAPRRMRLQRFLASAGVDSRRNCEQYILAGRVTVDGSVCAKLGTTVDPETQEIRLDGECIKPQLKRYYLLNKPAGYVCTNRDPAGRPLALDLVPDSERRLFTVGRLDETSEGLLLVTNDGELANRLAHPRYGVSRKYLLQVVGSPTPEVLGKLLRGMKFAEGVFRAKSVKKVRSRGMSTFLEIELTQGHNREVRRLLARLGHKVIHLCRISFGPLKLGRLPLGKFRPLRTVELNAIRDLAAGRRQSGTARHRQKRRTASADFPRDGRKPSRPRRRTPRRK
jgi:23S rRNA pseudouridine2605 synthase